MIKIIVNDKTKEKNKTDDFINNKSFKLKDEASLLTTINALIEDEEAAIKSYDVAIKNLEKTIDDTAKQVLINIMKDERRHVENLYAILNDNITEKNLEDSIKDDIDTVRIVGIRYNKYVVVDKTATKVLSPKFDDVDDAYDWIKKNYPRAKVLDSKVKDDVVSNYFYFDLDDIDMSLDNAVNIMKSCGLTIVKIDKNSKEAKVYYRGTSAAEQKAADKLDIFLEDSQNNDEIKLNFNNNHSIDENYFVGLEDLNKYMIRKNLDKYYILSDDEKLLEKHLESLPETLKYEVVNKSILTKEGDERKLYAIITFKE